MGNKTLHNLVKVIPIILMLFIVTFSWGYNLGYSWEGSWNTLSEDGSAEIQTLNVSEIYLNSVEKTFILEDTQAQGPIVAYVGDDIEKANYSNYFYVDGTNDHIQVEEAINYTTADYGMGTVYLDIDWLNFGGQVSYNGSGPKGWKAGLEEGVIIQGRGRYNGTTIRPDSNAPCFYLTNAPQIQFKNIKFNGSQMTMNFPFIHGDSQDLTVKTNTNCNYGLFNGRIENCFFRGHPTGRYLIELENPQDFEFRGINQFYVAEGALGAILINGTSLVDPDNRGDSVAYGYTQIWVDSENGIGLHVISSASHINYLWWDGMKLGLRGTEGKDNITGMKLEGLTNCRFDIVSEHMESVAQLYDCERVFIEGMVTSFQSDGNASTPAFDAWNPYPVMFYLDVDCQDITFEISNIFVRNGNTTILVDLSNTQKRVTKFRDTVFTKGANAVMHWNITQWTKRMGLSGMFGRSEHGGVNSFDIADGTTKYIYHYLMVRPEFYSVTGGHNETKGIWFDYSNSNSTHACFQIPEAVTADARRFSWFISINKKGW